MKLDIETPFLETFGELEFHSFSIGDNRIVFDILRNKIYSNPILAICREISCNARDAHRESKISDTPIIIHLPNAIEPYYKIKDFGPGISPDRIENVFVKYGTSTKREDNIQTGSFGLGAKTPFAYSDVFTVLTVHNGIKYNYNCIIDETKVGKLMLASQSPTNEKNGTEIMIPVQPKHFNEFRTYTEQSCRYWDVKPIIKGGQIEWQIPKFILEGKNWAINLSNDWRHNQSAKAIVDGIEYPLDLTVLRNYTDLNIIDSSVGQFIMYFGVGELSLSASRESIYLDEKTQKIISERLQSIQKEIKENITSKIKSFPNLWDANVFYNKELRNVFRNLNFLGKISWQGIELISGNLRFETKVYCFSKGKYSKKYGTDPNKLSRTHGNYIDFIDNTLLFFNDLGIKEPTARHVKKAFDDNKNLKLVCVISPNDNFTQAAIYKKHHLDKMNVNLLSSITKATGRAYNSSAQKLFVFKYDPIFSGFRQISYSSIDEDPNKKVLCTLKRDAYNGVRNAILSNKKYIGSNLFNSLYRKFPGYSFYGVDDGTSENRIEKYFLGFETLSKFLKETAFTNIRENYIEIKFAQKNINLVDKHLIKIFEKLNPLIKNPESLYFKRFNVHNKINEINKMDNGIVELYEYVHGDITESQLKDLVNIHPELNIEVINKNFNKRYPLLNHISFYSYESILKEIASYINLIDKEKENVQ